MKRALLIVAIALSTLSCTPQQASQATSVLAKVANVISDAGQILTLAELAYQQYARVASPPPEQQATFQNLLAASWRALNVASTAVRGSERLTQGEYDRAFQEFKTAYAALHAFLVQNGVTGAPGAVGAAPGAGTLPEPAALTFRVDP